MSKRKEFEALESERTKNKCTCPKCGHRILFDRPDKVICHWCNNYVFKDKKTEFEYRLKESINRNK